MDGGFSGSTRADLYEIDEKGTLTQSEKVWFPAYFRILPKGTAGKPPDAAGNDPEPSPEVRTKLEALRQTDPDALRFVAYLNNLTESLRELPEGSADQPDKSDKIAQLLDHERDTLMEKLRSLASMFLQGASSDEVLETAHEANGFFEGAVNTIKTPVKVVDVQKDRLTGLAEDIIFRTAAGNRLTEAQQRLIIDVGRALTVVSVVLSRREREARSPFEKLVSWLRSWLPGRDADMPASGPESPQRKRDSYIRRLAHIARSGLLEPDADYARKALETFKLDFVDMEADTVKNQYVRLLGQRALLFALLFGAAWVACLTIFADNSFAANAAPFLLTAVGACGGAWLSFAIRRVVLEFKDLALLEDDRLHPMSRILFVVGLTWLVGMFLQSGVVNAEVNAIQMRLDTSEIVALLIGAMCGIAERALAGAIGKRSEDFASRFGTSPAPPAVNSARVS